MIKVIKEGVVPKGQITCPNCQSILEYGNADTHDDWKCALSDELETTLTDLLYAIQTV